MLVQAADRPAFGRVLHVITGLNTGGAERALYNLLQGGLADRFDCRVVSLMNEGTMGPSVRGLGVPVTLLDMQRGVPSINAITKFHKVVKASQPDLIQGWMYHGNLAAWLARFFSRNNPVLVWNIRQSLYSLAEENFLTKQVIRTNRLLSKAPDSLLYNSHISRGQHELFGFSSRKGKVIPNGIDVQTYRFREEARTRVRSALNIPTDAQVVGHVARLHPIKDHPLFFRAALRLTKLFSRLHFILCGRDISFTNEGLQHLLPINILDRFHLLNERSDIPDLMNAMDVFSSSSRGEAFPNVLGEAMACGIPCVATDVGDSAAIVSDYGVVVPPRDETALANGMEKLLLMSSDKRRELGRRGRKHIVDNFALESVTKQYISTYEKLIYKRSVN